MKKKYIMHPPAMIHSQFIYCLSIITSKAIQHCQTNNDKYTYINEDTNCMFDTTNGNVCAE